MAVRIAIVAEAEADRRIVCDLIDRKLRHHAPDWLDGEHLDDYREWCGFKPGAAFAVWKDLKQVDEKRYRQLSQVRSLGFSGSRSMGYDGASARKALILCALATPRPDAVVLVRDMDNQAAPRRASIEAQRNQVAVSGNGPLVLLGLPDAKREAWVLNGFHPKTPEESSRLATLYQELGFDPCGRAEQLTSTSNLLKDPKRIVEALMGGDHARQQACWLEADWATLRERGEKTGLKDFLHEVQTRLLPLITGPQPRRQ